MRIKYKTKKSKTIIMIIIIIAIKVKANNQSGEWPMDCSPVTTKQATAWNCSNSNKDCTASLRTHNATSSSIASTKRTSSCWKASRAGSAPPPFYRRIISSSSWIISSVTASMHARTSVPRLSVSSEGSRSSSARQNWSCPFQIMLRKYRQQVIINYNLLRNQFNINQNHLKYPPYSTFKQFNSNNNFNNNNNNINNRKYNNPVNTKNNRLNNNFNMRCLPVRKMCA